MTARAVAAEPAGPAMPSSTIGRDRPKTDITGRGSYANIDGKDT